MAVRRLVQSLVSYYPRAIDAKHHSVATSENSSTTFVNKGEKKAEALGAPA